VFVATRNLAIGRDWIFGAPDVLIEVISPDGVERDRLVTRRLYAENGVREYWIVDPEERPVEALVLPGAQWTPHGYFRDRETVSTPALPGLSIPVGEI
jgi:Uma2 family endonuclease